MWNPHSADCACLVLGKPSLSRPHALGAYPDSFKRCCGIAIAKQWFWAEVKRRLADALGVLLVPSASPCYMQALARLRQKGRLQAVDQTLP